LAGSALAKAVEMDILLELVLRILEIYKWVVILAVIVTWLVQFNVVNTHNRFVYAVSDFLYRITEPALRPIRRVIPFVGGIDLSPIVLLLAIWVIQEFIIRYLLPALL
jgi:YggT family protein